MSVAVAVKKDGKTVLAVDSQVTFGTSVLPSVNHAPLKVRTIGRSFIALTGWGIYENILDHYLAGARAPKLGDSRAIFDFFLRFWRDLREKYTLVNDQCHEKDSPFGDFDSAFLVVNPDGIFSVSSNLSVAAFEQYYAIGSGADCSMGTLFGLYDQPGMDVETLATRAVESAIAFNIYCGGPVVIRHVAPPVKSRGARGKPVAAARKPTRRR